MEEIIMDESILVSIKKILGISYEYDVFDQDLIIHINTVLMILNQMGIGKNGFMIHDDSSTWRDFLGDANLNMNAVITWTALKVRMIFDPPITSAIAEAINSNLRELEWRIYITENYVGEI